ncbi:MAG: hypothetical protein ABIR79_01805 [Candidatus Binatia bacterium]
MSDTNTEDRYAGFLQPDVILPAQFFQSLRTKGQFDGERRLMIAVLEDAVNCFMKQIHAIDPKARQLFLDAEEWISADDRTWFFAFENVCDTLDLNPDYMREGLFKWRAAERRRVGDAAVAAAVAHIEEDDEVVEQQSDHGGLRLVNRG